MKMLTQIRFCLVVVLAVARPLSAGALNVHITARSVNGKALEGIGVRVTDGVTEEFGVIDELGQARIQFPAADSPSSLIAQFVGPPSKLNLSGAIQARSWNVLRGLMNGTADGAARYRYVAPVIPNQSSVELDMSLVPAGTLTLAVADAAGAPMDCSVLVHDAYRAAVKSKAGQVSIAGVPRVQRGAIFLTSKSRGFSVPFQLTGDAADLGRIVFPQFDAETASATLNVQPGQSQPVGDREVSGSVTLVSVRDGRFYRFIGLEGRGFGGDTTTADGITKLAPGSYFVIPGSPNVNPQVFDIIDAIKAGRVARLQGVPQFTALSGEQREVRLDVHEAVIAFRREIGKLKVTDEPPH